MANLINTIRGLYTNLKEEQEIKHEEVVEIEEAIIATDYNAGAEKTDKGYRPHVTHKEKGHTMYSGGATYKEKEHAVGHAQAYVNAYAKGGPNHADSTVHNYKEKHKEHMAEEVEAVIGEAYKKSVKEGETNTFPDGSTIGPVSGDAGPDGGMKKVPKVNEISNEKKAQYISRASLDVSNKSDEAGSERAKGNYEKSREVNNKVAKRLKNIAKAAYSMKKEEVELDEARRDAPKGDKNTSAQNPIVVVYDDLGTKGRAGISGNMNLKTFMGIHGISAKHQGTLAKLVAKMGKGKKVEVPANMLDDHKKEYENEGKRVPKVWIELNTIKEEVELDEIKNVDIKMDRAAKKLVADLKKKNKTPADITKAFKVNFPSLDVSKYIKEEVEITESHFKVGDEVKCKESGMTGKVVKVDPDGKGAYYTVKRSDGKEMKYEPEQLMKEGLQIDEALETRISGGKVPIGQHTLHYKTDKSHKYISNSIKERDPDAKITGKDGHTIVHATAQAHSSVIAGMRKFRVNGVVHDTHASNMKEEVEITEGNASAELEKYGKTKGGIDKSDFLAIARMIKNNKSAKDVGMMLKALDTDPRDKILSIISKADKKMGAEVMKAAGMKNLRAQYEEVEQMTEEVTVNEGKHYGLTQGLLDAVKGVLAADSKAQPLDPVDPKEAKKKFKDRKDKDIDNDGDVDNTDKYLAKKRKAVTKAVEDDKAAEDNGKKAKSAEDVKKGKGTKGQEAIDVNPKVNESIDDAVRRSVFGEDIMDIWRAARTSQVKNKDWQNPDTPKGEDPTNKDIAHAVYPKSTGPSVVRTQPLKDGYEEDKAKAPFKADPEKKKPAKNSDGTETKPMSKAKQLAKRGMNEEEIVEMSDKQMKKREEIVKSMKKNKGDFEKRYGDRAKDVMYATATKMAMKEGFELDEEALVEMGLNEIERSTVFNYRMKRLGQELRGTDTNKKSVEVKKQNADNASKRLVKTEGTVSSVGEPLNPETDTVGVKGKKSGKVGLGNPQSVTYSKPFPDATPGQGDKLELNPTVKKVYDLIKGKK